MMRIWRVARAAIISISGLLQAAEQHRARPRSAGSAIAALMFVPLHTYMLEFHMHFSAEICSHSGIDCLPIDNFMYTNWKCEILN